ncbi:hypothetical protein K3H35_19275 [Aeromonas veronii]|uniref:hypothetical protein n=1 Tax=Aeromonas veronii TaxID=654 RepID=UPI001F347B30|nr:hypothetical protein [Aeromonas veronii]MCF5910917.1 hypothetical protein [Aeromonas veronii]
MSVACNKCGSRNTEVVKAKDLAEASGDSRILTATAGAVSPEVVIGLLAAIAAAAKAIFEWLTESEKNEKKVVVCKDCGYWERV